MVNTNKIQYGIVVWFGAFVGANLILDAVGNSLPAMVEGLLLAVTNIYAFAGATILLAILYWSLTN